MNRRWLLALIGGALAIAVIAAGCGGGDDEDAGGSADAAGNATTETGSAGEPDSKSSPVPATKTISKAAFVKRANAICELVVRKVGSQVIPVLEEAGNSAENLDAAEAELVTSVLTPNLQAEVDQIGSLGAPNGDRAQVEAILAAIQDVVDKAEANPEAFASRGSGHYDKATKLADRYGLSECPYG